MIEKVLVFYFGSDLPRSHKGYNRLAMTADGESRRAVLQWNAEELKSSLVSLFNMAASHAN